MIEHEPYIDHDFITGDLVKMVPARIILGYSWEISEKYIKKYGDELGFIYRIDKRISDSAYRNTYRLVWVLYPISGDIIRLYTNQIMLVSED